MMSGSNPFRRDNRPTVRETANPSLLDDRTNASNGQPLLKVEVPALHRVTPTTKRVRIASPPVPISPETPASYASSPEEIRHSGLPGSASLTIPGSVPYAQALASNPFQSSLSDGEPEDVDIEVLENTRKNSALGSKSDQGSGEETSDRVKATLAKFASLPHKSAALPDSRHGEQNELSSNTSRPAMDVDAFKRLLLTGVSEPPTPRAIPALTQAPSQLVLTSDSSSSNTDTASISQHSISEPIAPTVADTPRTSLELQRIEISGDRGAIVVDSATNKKPPIPKPRHGKPLNHSATTLSTSTIRQATATADVPEKPPISSPSDLNKPLPLPPRDSSFPLVADASLSDDSQARLLLRRPPTPPLTRRQSQRSSQPVPISFSEPQTPPLIEQMGSASPIGQNSRAADSKAPPPPPTRRQKRASATQSQASEAIVQEGIDSYITSTQPQLSPASSVNSLLQPKLQPPPSRNPSAAKRLSRVSTASPTMAPPLPPPRRVRGSSRGSLEGPTAISSSDLDNGNNVRRPSTDSYRSVSGQSASKDILADLAALQKEVDTLRTKQKYRTDSTE
ncbi:hypothetical protein EPUS_07154 [Endocarpon pusillum Z07020]|uniref:Uncharacterized protein n=1 Tax=Endocarpon pusillum (strain Z07020 / HMAS-L-300199) TaxID=1263415 RepID=U1GAM7_ENDPU|nr:uncharacterized protein EPUS_07154 [Endocarpon pusillum Z07020]ERF68736.1 hypothetical protein EPUS_07154 [Endocarpon pusillum Z07020]